MSKETLEIIKALNQIKEDVYALYPNAVKVSLTFEGDKVTVSPVEKYEITVDTDGNNEE